MIGRKMYPDSNEFCVARFEVVKKPMKALSEEDLLKLLDQIEMPNLKKNNQ